MRTPFVAELPSTNVLTSTMPLYRLTAAWRSLSWLCQSQQNVPWRRDDDIRVSARTSDSRQWTSTCAGNLSTWKSGVVVNVLRRAQQCLGAGQSMQMPNRCYWRFKRSRWQPQRSTRTTTCPASSVVRLCSALRRADISWRTPDSQSPTRT